MKTSKTMRVDTREELEKTLAVLHAEGRRRAQLPVEDGGFNNLELIGFTKAMASIAVQAASLLDDDLSDDDED
jgi:hypothetical protein